jgi:uncharacterized protein Veg
MKVATAMLMSLFVAACAGAPRPPMNAPLMGKFGFNEHPAGMRGSLEGTFTIIGDTITVDATPGPCRPAQNPGPLQFVYSCSDVVLYFDKQDPIRRSSYRYTAIVQEKKTVCVQTEITATGLQRCVRTSVEVNDKPVLRNAILRTFPAPNGTK